MSEYKAIENENFESAQYDRPLLKNNLNQSKNIVAILLSIVVFSVLVLYIDDLPKHARSIALFADRHPNQLPASISSVVSDENSYGNYSPFPGIEAAAKLIDSPAGQVRLIDEVHHDETAFTEGLIFYNDLLYESAGEYGISSLRKVHPSDGSIIKSVRIADKFFAEGITFVDNKLYMLTWREGTLLVFDPESLELLGQARYPGEGWGLAYDGKHLIVADGTSTITFYETPAANTLHPQGEGALLTKVRQIDVHDHSHKVAIYNINELEYADGYLYGNIWYTDMILKIDLETGEVVRKFDCGSLYPKSERSVTADVMNGIAYNKKDKTFLVTGKLWGKYYSVELKE